MLNLTESIYSLLWKESSFMHYLFKRMLNQKQIKMSVKFFKHIFYVVINFIAFNILVYTIRNKLILYLK